MEHYRTWGIRAIVVLVVLVAAVGVAYLMPKQERPEKEQNQSWDRPSALEKRDYYKFFVVKAGTPETRVRELLEPHGVAILESYPNTELRMGEYHTLELASSSDVYAVDFDFKREDIFQVLRLIEQEAADVRGEITFDKHSEESESASVLAIDGRYILVSREHGYGPTLAELVWHDLRTGARSSFGAATGSPTVYALPRQKLFWVYESAPLPRFRLIDATTGVVTREFVPPMGNVQGFAQLAAVITPNDEKIFFSLQHDDLIEPESSDLFQLDLATQETRFMATFPGVRFPQSQGLRDGRLYLASNAPKGCAYYPYLGYVDLTDLSVHELSEAETTALREAPPRWRSPEGALAVVGYPHIPPREELGMCGGTMMGELRIEKAGEEPIVVERATAAYDLFGISWSADSGSFYYMRGYGDAEEEGAEWRRECVRYVVKLGVREAQTSLDLCQQLATENVPTRYAAHVASIETQWRGYWDNTGAVLQRIFGTRIIFQGEVIEESVSPRAITFHFPMALPEA